MKELTPIQRAGTALLMAIRDADANNKFFGPVDAADFLKRELEKAVPAHTGVKSGIADSFSDGVKAGWNECRKAFLGGGE